MNTINETFLIDTFDKVLKSQDLQKLVNVKKSESNVLEEHLISMSITSEQHKLRCERTVLLSLHRRAKSSACT